MRGGCYVPLPKLLRTNKFVVNNHNEGDFCFLEAINFLIDLRVAGIELTVREFKYPMSLSEIAKFERKNAISINVFAFDTKAREIYPVKISKQENIAEVSHFDLLIINNKQDNGNTLKVHYMPIIHFDRFMNTFIYAKTKKRSARLHCRRCLSSYRLKSSLLSHLNLCNGFEPQLVKMPENNILEFNYGHILRMTKAPFVIYADFESYLTPVNIEITSKTKLVHRHDINSFAYCVINNFGKLVGYEKFRAGVLKENVVLEFLKRLKVTKSRIFYSLKLQEF